MIEKSERLELRLLAKQKQQIKNLANKCGLSVSEYVLQRALNFEPKTIMPDVFYDFIASYARYIILQIYLSKPKIDF